MTRLSLLLRHPFNERPLSFGAVARVRWAGLLDGSPPAEWWVREQAVGVDTIRRTEFVLPDDGGIFAVEVLLARGEILSREYRIATGEERMADILLAESPHEFLSWQHIEGIVPARSAELLTESVAPQQEAFLGFGLPATRDALTSSLAAVSFEPRHRDWRYTHWEIPAPNDRALDELRLWHSDRFDALEKSAPPRSRWAYVSVNEKLRVISIPWAWWLERSDEHPIPSIAFDIVCDRARTRAVLTIRDEQWFPLLEFLSSGRLADAGAIVDRVVTLGALVEAVNQKRNGPLLAVAAAIVLIARTADPQPQEWDPWLENLANWFPQIPDGPILLGCRRLQQAREPKQWREAFAHLKTGVSRGIPYMSATIAMLSLALAQLANDVEETDEVRRQLATYATRIDPEQPFVVLR